MNTARRKITETYMRGVDEIFAVCRIDRATTDAGLLAVFDLARRARLQNISIICTKSDVRKKNPRSWFLVIAKANLDSIGYTSTRGAKRLECTPRSHRPEVDGCYCNRGTLHSEFPAAD